MINYIIIIVIIKINNIIMNMSSNLGTLVRAARPLKRNSTGVRASANIFAWYVGINGVGIEVICV